MGSHSIQTKVLWDLENVPLLSGFVDNSPVRLSIERGAGRFFKGQTEVFITAFAGVRENVPLDVRRALKENGIVLEYANDKGPDAADRVLYQKLEDLKNDNRYPINIVLIGGDHFYTQIMRQLQLSSPHNLLLVYLEGSISKKLKKVCKQKVDFPTFLRREVID